MSSYLLRLAQRLNSRYAPKDGFPPVFLMGDDEKLPDLHPFLTDLPKGSAIIIRSRSRHRRLDQIRGLKTPCRRFGLKILVADDWALAVSHHLDGVHLPGNRLKKFRFNHGRLRRPYPDFLITASAHSATAIQTARNCGVCGVFLSPIFPTRPLASSRSHHQNYTDPRRYWAWWPKHKNRPCPAKHQTVRFCGHQRLITTFI